MFIPPEAATAVDENVLACVESRLEAAADLRPFRLKLGSRRGHVGDRHVHPLHAPTLNLGPKIRNAEARYFSGFDQGNDRLSVPCGDRVDVPLKTTRPRSSNSEAIILTWRERDADQTALRAGVDRIDPQRIRFAGPEHVALPVIRPSPPITPRP